jgi:hypothetical protein
MRVQTVTQSLFAIFLFVLLGHALECKLMNPRGNMKIGRVLSLPSTSRFDGQFVMTKKSFLFLNDSETVFEVDVRNMSFTGRQLPAVKSR